MTTKFRLKRNSTSGVTPTTGDIDVGELAVNLTDRKLFTSNGTGVFELGSNLTNLAVTGNLTVNAVIANGSLGTNGQVLVSNGAGAYWGTVASGGFTNGQSISVNNFTVTGAFTANNSNGTLGQVLTSNGSGIYWAAAGGVGTVTTVNSGIGLTGGPITSSGTLSVLANNGITANSTGLFVTPGTGTIVNSTGVHVNSTFIGTLTANNANNLNGNPASFYTNATNIDSGTLNNARLPSTINVTTVNSATISAGNTNAINITTRTSSGSNGATLSGSGTAGMWLVANTLSTTATSTGPRDIFFKPDGLKMYLVDSTVDRVLEYDLSTAWNVATATLTANVSSVDTVPEGLFFRPNGSKMYVAGASSDLIREFDLSTPWSVNTASLVGTFSIVSQEAATTGVAFSNTGSKMFVTGTGSDAVLEYDLSTPWSVNTAVYNSQSFSVAAQDTSPHAIHFNPTGTRMYIIGIGVDALFWYDLSTAWSVNTAIFVDSRSLALESRTPLGIWVEDSVNKAWLVDDQSDRIVEYSTNNAGLNVNSAINHFTGITDFASSVAVTRNLRVGDSLIVENDVTVQDDFAVGGDVTFSGTTESMNIGTSQTTGNTIIGGPTQTGMIQVGRSTANQTVSIANGATVSGSTKIINIGTEGLSGSNTTINIGSALGDGTVTINETTLLASNTFTVGTAAYVVANGNVGIGNTTPDARLTVTGTANVSGNVVIGGTLNAANVTAALFTGNVTGTASNATNLNSQPASFYTNATNLATGTVPTARLGTGTADSTTFLAGDQTYKTALTSVASGNGLSGGPITTTGTLAVLANNGIVSNTSGVFVQAGTGVTVNSTGVHIGQAVSTTSSVTFGTLSITGNTALGDATADIVSINGSVNTNIMPAANITYSLGNSTMRWSQLQVANVNALTGRFDGNVEITGSLTITGSVSNVSVTDLIVSDPLIHIGANNEISDLVDLGWVGHYSNDSGVTKRHAGLFRDATDGTFKIFTNLVQANLDTANALTINTAAASYSTATLQTFLTSGGLTTNSTAVNVTANSTVAVAIVANTVSGAFTGNLTGTASNATNLNSQPASFYTNATNLATGTVPTARLGTGTANTTTFLGGDQTYKTAVTSVATGSGLSGGPITTTGTVAILANSGITANATGLFVTPGTGTVVNSTGVHVNATYIATLDANNSANFNGQPASFYTNATNLATGTVPTARLGTGTANSTTFLAGDQTYKTALTTAVTSVASGNGLSGGPITTTGTLAVLANNGITVNTTGVFVNANNGITANTTGVFVTPGTGTVVNSTGVHVNSAFIGTLTANNATNFNSQPASFYANATNLSTGTLDNARLPTTVNLTTVNAATLSVGTTSVVNSSGFTTSANVLINSTGELVISPGAGIFANGSLGTAGQALFSNGSSIYWATPAAGVNTAAQFAWTNTHTFQANLTILDSSELIIQAGAGIQANGSFGTAGQVLSSDGTSVYWATVAAGVNTAAQFSWTNTHSFAANLTIGATSELIIANGAGIQANGTFGTAGQVLSSNSTGVYWADGGISASSTATLTNKRIDPRVSSTASATSVTPDIGSFDMYIYTALAAAITINATTSGTPVNGNKLTFRFKDNGTARGITWTTSGTNSFRAIGVTLPTTTVINKVTYVGCIYNAAESFWDVVAVLTQA